MRPNGVLLKQERMRQGLSQLDVADATELSRRTVQHAEAGKEGVLVNSVYAIADVLKIDRSDALIDEANLIDNRESFSIWPWRLFEFLGKRILPSGTAFIQSPAEAEEVVGDIWKGWQIHLAKTLKKKPVCPNAIEKWNKRDFTLRYMSLWEQNPTSIMCSSVNGKRSGASVLLPVDSNTYESFLTGQISSINVPADCVVEESQNLIYDAMVEFEGPQFKKRHRITDSISFISFYQIAVLSQNSTAENFRIATYGGAEENVERMANAGLIETDWRTPDFNDSIWEYSGQFERGFHRINEDVLDRSSTSAHYVAMMKRWASSKASTRIKVKAALNALHVYQRIVRSTSSEVGRATTAG